MKKVSITLQLTPSLKDRLETIARYEDRTAETQAIRLIEEALRFFSVQTEAGGTGSGTK